MIPGARVDIWHADAQGIYSGYEGQGDARNLDTTGQSFLRGTQVADVNRLLKQYAQLKQMMKGLKQMEGRMGKFKGAMPFLPR